MALFLTYGEPGTGKSTQHAALCKILTPSVYLCLEIKDDELLTQSGVQAIPIMQIDRETYLEDPVSTLFKLESSISDIIHGKIAAKTVVVDGISDIRTFAMKEWIFKDNIGRAKPRKTVGGENLTAWSDINDRVKNILEPLINWGNIHRANIFFTAQMKDSYTATTDANGKRVSIRDGKEINAKEWVEYDVDVKCHLRRDAASYTAEFIKVPGWSKPVEKQLVEIPRDGMIGLLAERGLVRM